MSAKPFIVWQEEMAIGIEPFDREHRELLEAINRLHAVAGEAIDHAAFVVAVDDLIRIAEGHFSHEERVLQQYACPNLGMHQREHDELLDDVTALHLIGNDAEEVTEMLEMLRDWLLDHIMHFDRGYRDCLEGKVIR